MEPLGEVGGSTFLGCLLASKQHLGEMAHLVLGTICIGTISSKQVNADINLVKHTKNQINFAPS